MLKIGITGNIGSGKTTVSRIFELLGVPVFYADDAAKQVMTQDHILVNALISTFGAEAYFADGSLNRKYIANIVFSNPAELAKLNAIVHPATFRAFDAWLLKHADAEYIIKEAALLFESDSYKMCDYSMVVTAPLSLRMQRVTGRDGVTPAEAESRNARQLPEEEKVKRANFTISNDESQLVIPQVLHLHQHLTTLARQQ